MATPNDVLTYENDTLIFVRSASQRLINGLLFCFMSFMFVFIVGAVVRSPDAFQSLKLPPAMLGPLIVTVLILFLVMAFRILGTAMVCELRCDLKTGRYDCVSGLSFYRRHRTGAFDDFARLRLVKYKNFCAYYLDWKTRWAIPTSLGTELDTDEAHRTLYRLAADLHIPAVGGKSYLKQHPEALNQPGKRPASANHFDLLDHPDPPEHHNVMMHVVDRSKGTD